MSLSFGSPAPGAFSFSSPAKPATTGIGLPTSQPSAGLFGTPASSAPAFGAGTPAFGSAAPGFGASSTPAFGSTGLGTTGGLNFGAGSNTSTSTSTGLAFGAPISSATTGGLSFGTPASTASTGLGGGGLGGFSFGGTPASTAATTQSLGFGLLGSTTASTASGLFGPNLGTSNATSTQATISATPSVGLGGLATNTTGITGAGNTTSGGNGKGAEQQPKQTKLPNEISTTVDSFKEFVKKQKSLSSDVMRVSIKPLHKVTQEAAEMISSALALTGEVGRARAHSRRLRAVAAKALAAAERASRELPGLEYEGQAPPAYVMELIAELESQLLTFKRQMDAADKQMQQPPRLLTEQELTLGMRRIHESLVALAGRLQTVHAQVEAQKEQYLNLRKYILKDPTNIFENQTVSARGNNLDSILQDGEGSRKKSKLWGFTDVGPTSAVLSDPKAALGSIQRIAGPTPFTYLGSSLSAFPAGNVTVSGWGQPQPAPQPSFNRPLSSSFTSTGVADTSSSSFQLQKPPKRGKQ